MSIAGDDDPRTWIGSTVTGTDTDPLGRVVAVYTDDATGRPTWAAVDDGSGPPALVPLDRAEHDGSGLRVPYGAAQVRAAPHGDPPERISHDDGIRLHRDFVAAAAALRVAPAEAGGQPAAAAAHPAALSPGIPATPGAGDGWAVRHEEELRVSTETVVTGRVRVRKFAVTEEQTFTVQVTREEVTVEHEEVPVAARVAEPGAALGEEVHEVIRYEERVVVTKELVPVERIRVVRTVVAGQPEIVRGVVRREVLDVEQEPAQGA
ncbi:MAG TPA: YsnF/AvaK domain-containing protein, partial [Pseudonocardia sp.]|nr:YsnF/AvaK domain-containing protein [Pseudonocardia sp.]